MVVFQSSPSNRMGETGNRKQNNPRGVSNRPSVSEGRWPVEERRSYTWATRERSRTGMSPCVHVWCELPTFRHGPCSVLKFGRRLRFLDMCKFVVSFIRNGAGHYGWRLNDAGYCKNAASQSCCVCWADWLCVLLFFDMVLADFLMDGVTANDFPGGTCVICFWGLHFSLSLSISPCLSLSIPRPTNFVLEASNPIITKLTVNTQVSYPYWLARNANIIYMELRDGVGGGHDAGAVVTPSHLRGVAGAYRWQVDLPERKLRNGYCMFV